MIFIPQTREPGPRRTIGVSLPRAGSTGGTAEVSLQWFHISHQQLLFTPNNAAESSPLRLNCNMRRPDRISTVGGTNRVAPLIGVTWSTAASAASLQPMFPSSPPLPDQTARRPQPHLLCWQRLGRTLHHLRHKPSATGRAPTSAGARAKSSAFSGHQDEFLAALIYSEAQPAEFQSTAAPPHRPRRPGSVLCVGGATSAPSESFTAAFIGSTTPSAAPLPSAPPSLLVAQRPVPPAAFPEGLHWSSVPSATSSSSSVSWTTSAGLG